MPTASLARPDPVTARPLGSPHGTCAARGSGPSRVAVLPVEHVGHAESVLLAETYLRVCEWASSVA